MDLARLGNKYLAETEPWKVYKTDPARVGTILNIALQIAANLSIVGEVFLPFSAKKINEHAERRKAKLGQSRFGYPISRWTCVGCGVLCYSKKLKTM